MSKASPHPKDRVPEGRGFYGPSQPTGGSRPSPIADSRALIADPLEAYLAGVISTFPAMSARHPADCLPIARAVLDALAEWQPDDTLSHNGRSEP